MTLNVFAEDVPPVVVTVTLTDLDTPDGTFTTIFVSLQDVYVETFVLPNFTYELPRDDPNSDPFIVMVEPTVPDVGDMEVTEGVGSRVVKDSSSP